MLPGLPDAVLRLASILIAVLVLVAALGQVVFATSLAAVVGLLLGGWHSASRA